jgi:hypothetical protein
MALHWNIGKIKNSETVCWEVADKDDVHRGRVKGEKYMKLVTEAITYATMAVDIGKITAKNVDEFFRRIQLYETAFGGLRYNATGKQCFTREEVEAHIGLSTNVITITPKQYDARIKDMLFRDLQAKVRLANKD